MEQAVPITGGGQGKQPLAAGIHVRPPVQTTCGNIRERVNGARDTTWNWCVHPLKKTPTRTETCLICRGNAQRDERL